MRALLALILVFAAVPALAHPHVWVIVRAELLYGPDGKVSAIRHAWTFDEGYSAFVTQGMVSEGRLDTVGAGELARTNVESLAESGYFTTLRAGGTKQAFAAPRDAELGLDGRQLTLRFTLPLQNPAASARLLFDVADPSFFVDFQLADGDPVRLENAPAGCSVSVQRPKPAAKVDEGTLSEAMFQALSATTSSIGGSFATRTLVSCK
jgi:ABC-type uncharacterized transport system substrate-binding protein